MTHSTEIKNYGHLGHIERVNGTLHWRVNAEHARPGVEKLQRMGACLSHYDALLKAREVLA